MAVLNSIAASADEMTEWRRYLHAHPELGMDCFQTAAFVVDKLKRFGVDEIHQGVGGSGVVAIIRGQGEGPAIGLRADMDALPMHEATGAEHASTVPGRMHACGHDGHTTMLLGAAKYLAETRRFRGSVALIFQPGEEVALGAKAMLDDGIIERFGITRVFGLHADPDADLGWFSSCPGPVMAAVDFFEIRIAGRGGHGAYPETTADPVAAALQIGQALQTIVGRNIPSQHQAVLSLTVIETGSAFNIIPQSALLKGTVRTHQPESRDLIEARMGEITRGIGAAMGVEATLDYRRFCDTTVNDPVEFETAAAVAREIIGAEHVETDLQPQMGGEDFAAMLAARPGAFLFLGTGKGPGLHNERFDFNDAAAPIGASYFARLVETVQPL